MNKKEFLLLLNKKLSKLPKKEIKERALFYSEMIDDRVEDGLSEEEAVLEIGNIEDIANQIILEVSSNEDIKKKSLKTWEIVLLAIGSPIWGSLLLVAFVVLWSLLITFWAIEIPFLIFSFISKYLFIGCKYFSIWIIKLTKNCFKKIGNVICS